MMDKSRRNMAIVAAYQRGWSTPQVAQQFGMTHQSVAYILRKAGVALRPSKIDPETVTKIAVLYARGIYPAEIARMVNVGDFTVRKHLKRLGIRQPQEKYPPAPPGRDDEIERRFLAGQSYDGIAAAMGLNRNIVAGVCNRRGLRREAA